MNPPKKEPISEKKAAANRRNAQKSTGPRTSEGKNQSKLNAFQHGMRAAATVLPHEDSAAFEARKLAWKEELQPAGEFETYLVDLVVDNSWRLDRCRRAEASRLARQVRDARGEFDRAIADRNRALIEELPQAPARVAAQLRETSVGTAWLIERFEWLLGALDCRGYWEPSETDHALNLFGRSADQIFSDPMVLDISEAFLNSGWIEETNPSEIASLLNLDLYPRRALHSALRDLMKHREAKAEDSEPPPIEDSPTPPEQPTLAPVAPNEPTADLPEVAQVPVEKDVAKPKFKGYRKPAPPPPALSQVRGYGGAVPLDPARWPSRSP